MRKQEIDGEWRLLIDGEGERIPATVPGSVYHDLLQNGKMEDPYWRDSENEALEWMEHDFVYETSFEAEKAVASCDEVLLHCDGIDTIAEIHLNNYLLGKTNNMHRIWKFPVKDRLIDGINVLNVRISSPTRFIRERFKECTTLGSSHAMEGFPQIRKAHCMFGWDWGPRLPDAGIWKNISLIGVEACGLNSVYITQEHKKEGVKLYIDTDIDVLSEDSDICYVVTVSAPDGRIHRWEESPKSVLIEQPMLWWPNGFGEQNLYQVKVELYADEKQVDVWQRRIGLRTMTIKREKDKYGESFAHEINGVTIFAMGADYIPEDSIYSRITEERTRKLLWQCKEANFNCIRVWGGGFYPHDYFFDICDEYGLIVWQDLMFACAVYELDDSFDANIRAEIRDNVQRIRHHASLGLWCGNNEMEMFVDKGQWVNTLKQKADYIKMYEYIIPQVLEEEDPQTFYWPASPSSGGSFDFPNDPDRGDVHYWEVWHGNKPFSEYRKYFFRYVSEFGFQSFPSFKTVESFTLPEDRNIFSYVMEKHQRNDAANGKIMNYLYQTFLYPNDFETLLYASQLLQGEAIKYGVEHFRRNRGRCMGAVYWQLNDCWPVASWASIDYFGRWKALHYYAKRFFAPVLLSCQEEGQMTQEPNINAEHQDIEKSVIFNVSNETMQEKTLRIVWDIRNKYGEVLRSEERFVEVPALSAVWLEKDVLPKLSVRDEYISYELYEGEQRISSSTVILTLPKFFRYVNPKLRVRAEGDELVVKSEAYAKSVEILNENENLILEDNYFDMNPGERRIKIHSGNPEKLRIRSVYDIR